VLFNSYAFIFAFLPVVFIGFFWIGRSNRRMAALWLAAASLFFYGWWNPKFVLLLAASVVANYAFGIRIARSPGTAPAKRMLVVALVANLTVLGIFKYTNFFLATVAGAGGPNLGALDIVLPLGISFFTFTQIAFLVDAYRGLAREYSFIHYLLFVSYFPHLIAGPILHHKEMMPQFEAPETYRLRPDLVAAGLTLFTLGLAKKVLLADSFAGFADQVFDAARDGAQPQFFVAWSGALAYTMQLYFDFSGYSDMAVGLSLLFGVRLPLNFASPYKARNIIEFWRRWHMTLSRFLRDYLYFPLGGNRRGPLRRYLNLMVTMLLGGLWHGASWTFVAWGGLHGLMLALNHAWQAARARLGWNRPPTRLGAALCVAITFGAVVVGWVLFRAPSFDAAVSILAGMAGLNGISLPRTAATFVGHAEWARAFGVEFQGLFHGASPDLARDPRPLVLLLSAGLAIVWGLPNTQQFAGLENNDGRWRWKPTPAFGVAMGVILALSLVSLTRPSTFLYYQF
jgi:alginate O-acetyltransferase complex protein AlgI